MEGYKCFGCADKNESGLQMDFYEDGDFIISKWRPRDIFQGYFNILHGGIQATMIDEISSWVVFKKCHTAGVTSSLNVRYKKPVFCNKDGEITIKAKLNHMKRNIAVIDVQLYDQDNRLCAEGLVNFFTFDKEKAIKEFQYPNPDSF